MDYVSPAASVPISIDKTRTQSLLLRSMHRRPSRAWILCDLGGGLSLAGLLIPEGIAYSSIAGLPPSFGITSAIIGPLAYAIVGRSRLAVVSTTSGAAALLAAGIADAALPDVPRIDCAIALTALVGIFFLLASALRITTLTSFISRAVLHGFGFGLALTISIRQLPSLVGLRSSGGTPWRILADMIAHAREVHIPSLVLGVLALALLAVFRRLRFSLGGLSIVAATVLAMRLGPGDHFGIATGGELVLQWAWFHLPVLTATEWLRLAQYAFPIAIVILAESWATVRALAAVHGDPISAQREISALGIANLASAALRGLPVGAGFSVGNASKEAGTTSMLGSILAALAVALVVFTIPRSVTLIPQPVLAAIVISALTHALSPKPILSLFRLHRDQWIAITAALGVLSFGIIDGLLLAVALSLIGLLRRLTYPSLSELGRTGAHNFVDCAAHPEAKSVAGILVIRPNAPLFFGNADTVLAATAKRATAKGVATVVFSLEESDDIDSSALEALSDFRAAMVAQKRSLILARVHDRVRAVLERGGLADLAANSTFSVDDAVSAALRGQAQSEECPC